MSLDVDQESLKNIFTIVAVTVSIASFLFARRSWQRSNRPIVTVYLEEEDVGNINSPFNLIVANSGTRPAVRVTLCCDSDEASRLAGGPTGQSHHDIVATFGRETEIAILRNGEELRTAFGMIAASKEAPELVRGASAEVTVSYFDLDGNKYRSRIRLLVGLRNGFGGSRWSRSKPLDK